MAWARVWGGPTEGSMPLNLRVELMESLSPASKSGIELRALGERGETARVSLRFDDQNVAYATLQPSHAPPYITVAVGDHILASGTIQLDRVSYWRNRRTRDGWAKGKSVGAWTIRVGCREGALALGHAGHLGISITEADGRPVIARLSFELDGLDPTPSVMPANVPTDERGQAALRVTPRDLSASIRVNAFDDDSRAPVATYFAAIPISSTALVGRLEAGRLAIDSGIPVPRVYYALVGEQGVWASGGLDRTCSPSGPCSLGIALTVVPEPPAWLILGTEPSLDGPTVIGWPVLVSGSTYIPDTVVVPDRLLLDGKSEVEARMALARALRFRHAVLGLSLAWIALAAAFSIPVLRARRQAATLLDELSTAERRMLVERRTPSAALAILLMGLGFLALLLWMRSRILGR